MKNNTKVRFAPSPTGALHIGGLRTALFNYLFAKKNGGEFIVRLEDTDQNRYNPNSEKHIYESLKWLGIEPDESPKKGNKYGSYRQSERLNIYNQYITKLIDSGLAYYAFDTAEEIEEIRKKGEQQGGKFLYSYLNRNHLKNDLSLDKDEVEKRLKTSEYVVRLKYNPSIDLVVKDALRGYIPVTKEQMEDKVLFKSDGFPTYHLANVIDDHKMKITDVIRGEEWLPSLPVHGLLYDYLGFDRPNFYHLPLILKPQGKGKLSKRDGAKFGFPIYALNWEEDGVVHNGFKESGYLNTAVLNFLALLGWNPKNDTELFSKEQLEEVFDISHVNLSGAKFDIEKLNWFNQQHIQKLSSNKLEQILLQVLQEKGITTNLRTKKIIDLIKDRIENTNEIYSLTYYFFEPPKSYNKKQLQKCQNKDSDHKINGVVALLQNINTFCEQEIEKTVKDYIKQNDYKIGEIMQLLRIALVGELKGVSIFTIMEVIGKEEVIKRLNSMVASFTK